MRRDDEVATLREPPPHSIEAESSVLGGMLLDHEAINRVPGLSADDFYRPEHRLILRRSVPWHQPGSPLTL